VKQHDEQERELRYREYVCLLAEHERQLSGYVHALVPLWQDAEDVLQEVKLRLWEQFDSFRRNADFAAWAITIASYMVRAHRKRCQRGRVHFSDELLEKISQHVSAISSSGRDERVSALMECARTLSDANRKLLGLFLRGHQKIKDIARELGQTPSTTRKSLYRIRRSLFECAQKRLQEGMRR
jgi:RNA polymerase sigma-70 factor, ECF subfamily